MTQQEMEDEVMRICIDVRNEIDQQFVEFVDFVVDYFKNI